MTNAAAVVLSTPLLKIPLLITTARAVHLGFTPPQPPPENEERRTYSASDKREALPTVGSWGLVPFKVLTYTVASVETCLLLCEAFPALSQLPLASSILKLVPGGLSQITKLHTTSSTVLGTLLLCAGAYLRRECFRRLGRQFTFELSIQKDHRLVTDGPYAFVRHPGYSALVTQTAGLLLCIAGRGSWWREFAAHTLQGKVLGVGVGLLIAICLVCGIDRTYKEDRMLRELFEEKWVDWAQRTKYRMVPFLF